ncbi:hypothetical protein F4803DRAFT_448769 [Xylaria telfairii]|nr:hypothetical protein F4803DRAFT_448769 [Xylaria telfairii]
MVCRTYFIASLLFLFITPMMHIDGGGKGKETNKQRDSYGWRRQWTPRAGKSETKPIPIKTKQKHQAVVFSTSRLLDFLLSEIFAPWGIRGGGGDHEPPSSSSTSLLSRPLWDGHLRLHHHGHRQHRRHHQTLGNDVQ